VQTGDTPASIWQEKGANVWVKIMVNLRGGIVEVKRQSDKKRRQPRIDHEHQHTAKTRQYVAQTLNQEKSGIQGGETVRADNNSGCRWDEAETTCRLGQTGTRDNGSATLGLRT
jgi:hypothetical protein